MKYKIHHKCDTSCKTLCVFLPRHSFRSDIYFHCEEYKFYFHLRYIYNIYQNGTKFPSWNHNLISYYDKPSNRQNYFRYLRGNHLQKLWPEKLYYPPLSVDQTTTMASKGLLYILNSKSTGKALWIDPSLLYDTIFLNYEKCGLGHK